MHQSLIADTCHRTPCVATDSLRTLDIILLKVFLDVLHQFVCLYLRECQIDDTLDAESQSQDEGEGHKRHKTRITVDKLRLQLFVETTLL